jgi:methylthioribose-1-phosphate isomerase
MSYILAYGMRECKTFRHVICGFGDVTWSPKNARTFNPSFDVTPVENVTSLVFDMGVYTQVELKSGELSK